MCRDVQIFGLNFPLLMSYRYYPWESFFDSVYVIENVSHRNKEKTTKCVCFVYPLSYLEIMFVIASIGWLEWLEFIINSPTITPMGMQTQYFVKSFLFKYSHWVNSKDRQIFKPNIWMCFAIYTYHLKRTTRRECLRNIKRNEK